MPTGTVDPRSELAAIDALIADTAVRRDENRQRDAALVAVRGPLVAADGRRYAQLSRLQRRVLGHLYAQLLAWEAGAYGEPGPGRTYHPAAGGLLWHPTWLLGLELETAETTEARGAAARTLPWRRTAGGQVRQQAEGPRMPTAERTAASRALLRLVERGLVERTRTGSRGGQATYVRFTPAGRALAEALLEQTRRTAAGASNDRE